MPVSYPYTQYSGTWNLTSQGKAQAAGTWPALRYSLFTWGANSEGQLGQNNITNRSSPTQVGALTTWASVQAGSESILAIKTDGTLWACGSNGTGGLGDGTTITKSSPVQVGALTNWSKVACGNYHVLAVKTDGTLWSWGNNNYGALGIGSSGLANSRSSPTQVGNLTTWANVFAGAYTSFAIKTDGTLWSWGAGTQGQLGLNIASASGYRSSPVQVGTLTNWLSGACGERHMIAIKTDGTLWTCGGNGDGQLGQNNAIYRSSPVQVGALSTWQNSAVTAFSSMVTKTNGTLWTWGYNNAGQIGDNTVYSKSSPVQVGALTTWSSVYGGAYTSLAIKTDGTLWVFGQDESYGKLGLNTRYINKSSPTQVGTATTWYSAGGGTQFCFAIQKTFN